MIINSYYYNRAGVEMVARNADGRHKMLAKPSSSTTMTNIAASVDFVGYHDGAIDNEFYGWITREFPTPSRFESDSGVGAWNYAPAKTVDKRPHDVVLVVTDEDTDDDIRLALRNIGLFLTNRGRVFIHGRTPGWVRNVQPYQPDKTKLSDQVVAWRVSGYLTEPTTSPIDATDGFPYTVSVKDGIPDWDVVAKAEAPPLVFLRDNMGEATKTPSEYEHVSGGVEGRDRTAVRRAIELVRLLRGPQPILDPLRAAADDAENVLNGDKFGCDERKHVNHRLLLPLKAFITKGDVLDRTTAQDAQKPCCGKRREPLLNEKGEHVTGEMMLKAVTKAGTPPPTTDETGPTGERNCMECCQKHLERAIVYLGEYATHPAYRLELRRARGNLGLAEDHALGVDVSIATRIRDIRLKVSPGGDMNIGEAVRLTDSVCDLIDKLVEART